MLVGYTDSSCSSLCLPLLSDSVHTQLLVRESCVKYYINTGSTDAEIVSRLSMVNLIASTLAQFRLGLDSILIALINQL
jgi:hypothetical protein